MATTAYITIEYIGMYACTSQDVDEFYAKHWERRALLIKRPAGHRDYYGGWLSSDDMRTIISQQSLRYGTDLDVTNFVNGRRVTCTATIYMLL
jgi:hypothetical protein